MKVLQTYEYISIDELLQEFGKLEGGVELYDELPSEKTLNPLTLKYCKSLESFYILVNNDKESVIRITKMNNAIGAEFNNQILFDQFADILFQ